MSLEVYRAHILAQYYYQITLCKHWIPKWQWQRVPQFWGLHVSLERNATVLELQWQLNHYTCMMGQ